MRSGPGSCSLMERICLSFQPDSISGGHLSNWTCRHPARRSPSPFYPMFFLLPQHASYCHFLARGYPSRHFLRNPSEIFRKYFGMQNWTAANSGMIRRGGCRFHYLQGYYSREGYQMTHQHICRPSHIHCIYCHRYYCSLLPSG
ncbi:Uncharacterised protein [uncultured archaeon]|nr:Uncharacterised protein [uncultured archaeon]